MSSNNLNSGKQFRLLINLLQNMVIQYVIAITPTIYFSCDESSIKIHITDVSIIISMGRNSICAFYGFKKRSRHRTKQQFKQKSHTIRTVPKMPRKIRSRRKNRCPYKYLTTHFPSLVQALQLKVAGLY